LSDGEGEATPAHAGRGQETEWKLGIPDEPTFEALMREAGGRREPPALQENVFFDTPDGSLRRRHIGLRLRREGDAVTLTAKGPAAASGRHAALAERAEIEAPVDPERAARVLERGEPLEPLLELLEPAAGTGAPAARALLEALREATAGSRLHRLGSFRNERVRVSTALRPPGGGPPREVVLEFDCTDFGAGVVEREVELEVDEPGAADALGRALHALFERVGARPTPTTSKLVRFQQVLDRRG